MLWNLIQSTVGNKYLTGTAMIIRAYGSTGLELTDEFGCAFVTDVKTVT